MCKILFMDNMTMEMFNIILSNSMLNVFAQIHKNYLGGVALENVLSNLFPQHISFL